MQNATKQNFYSILLTATILTIFEIVFFYVIVVPGINNSMKSNLNKIITKISNRIKETNSNNEYANYIMKNIVFNEKVGSVFKTFQNRENEIINKNNMYTIYTGVIILLMLSIGVVILFRSLDDYVSPTIFATFTVICLIVFQIFFYFYGLNYKYESTNELLSIIYDNLNTFDKQTTIKKLREQNNEQLIDYTDDEILQMGDNMFMDLVSQTGYSGENMLE